MDCNKLAIYMSLYIDKELNDENTVDLHVHISECDDCKKEYDEYMKFIDSLKSIPNHDTPVNFHAHIMKNLEEMSKPIDIVTKKSVEEKINLAKDKIRKTRSFNYKKFGAIAAGFVVVFMSLGISLNRQSPPLPTDTNGAEFLVADSQNPKAEFANAEQTPLTHKNGDYIKEYSVTIEVDDFDKAVAQINAMDGTIYSSDIAYDDSFKSYANITKRVDAAGYDQCKNSLSSVGKILYENEAATSVTYPIIDAEASLKAKETETERLFTLLENSTSVEVMTAVESQLSIVEQEKNSIKLSLANYYDDVERPYIYVNIISADDSQFYGSGSSFGDKLQQAFLSSFNYCMMAIQAILVILSAVIVPLAFVVVIIVIILFIINKRKRRNTLEK